MEKRLPKLSEVLFVLIGFGVIMVTFIVMFEISIHLALLTTWFLIMVVGLKIGYSYKEMQDGLLKGVTDGLEAVLVLIIGRRFNWDLDCWRRCTIYHLLRLVRH